MSHMFKVDGNIIGSGSNVFRVKDKFNYIGRGFNNGIPSGTANYIYYDSPRKRLLVTAQSNIFVYDCTTLELTNTISGFSNAICVRKDPLNNRFCVQDLGEGKFVSVDYDSLVKGANISDLLDYAPSGFVYSGDGTRLIYCNNSSTLYIVDSITNDILATINPDGSDFTGVAAFFEYNKADNIIWITQATNKVVLLNTDSFEYDVEIMGVRSWTIAFDPNPTNNKIFTTSPDGTFSVSYANSYGLVSDTQNAPGAGSFSFRVDPIAGNNRWFYLLDNRPFVGEQVFK